MRPITPNNNAPNEKLAIWLLNKFNSMNVPFQSNSIMNTLEFVNKIKDIEIADNEIQVSFDVESMLSSVPIDIALDILKGWLCDDEVVARELDVLVNLTKICMEENWFQFNGNFYKQNHGCSNGSPLSPFIANLFMSHFETQSRDGGIFPRVRYRYVDEVLGGY